MFQPMYGMPQANTYGQYGFPGYAGAPGAASPGMPQAAAGTPAAAGLGLGAVAQQGSTDPSAVAAAGQAQGQWPAGDPSSYYSNYWGGRTTFSLAICDYTDVNLVIQGIMGKPPASRVRQMVSTKALLEMYEQSSPVSFVKLSCRHSIMVRM